MASSASTNPAHAHFESFLQAQLCQDVLSSFQGLCGALGLEPGGGLPQYRKLKAQLNYWSAKSLWAKLDKRAEQPVYQQGRACARTKCLVVGAGPCGLRAAVELALLGARVVLVEKRTKFSRHNVLHLWPFTIHDLRALGAKKFYGRFCTGTLDHISIRQLQLLLLKVVLLLGVEIHWGVTFTGLQPPPKKGSGWRARLQPHPPAPLANYEFDVLISAAGGKFVPEGFTVREMRGKLAIGITVNFVNRRTVEETQVPEISGVARIYNQSFFQSLLKATGIDLENIVYYKDDTHYFVMTAKKQCLLRLGVLRQDWPEIDRLLGSANVVPEALQCFVRAAADFATNGKLGKLEFARDAHGRPDISAFDFTSMMRAESSARVQEKDGARLLLGLVGDCLVEPFWPLGTGVARGFLAAFDAAWMVKRWAEGAGPLEVLAERESLYQLLSQTSPENMHRNVAQYELDPATRYPTLNLRAVTTHQVQDLYDVMTKEPGRRPSDKPDAGKPATGTQEELLRWCQEQTAGYPGVHVTDLSSSWADGRALCALVHRLRPGLLEPAELRGVGALEATAWALKVAEHELGIPPVLSAKAVVAGSDPLGLIAYLSHFHSTFKNMAHGPGGPEGPARQGFPGTSSAVLFLGKLQRTLQRPRAQENREDTGGKKPRLEGEAKTPSTEEPPVPESDVPPTPPSQHQEAGAGDLCALCGEHLYILERLCADGRFFHRSCFRCHTCEATLWPGGYRQHPGDGHFYCLQHLPQEGPEEDGGDQGPGSQDLPVAEDASLPSGPSPAATLPEGTRAAPSPGQPTRRLIRLSSLERQRLSSLRLTPEPELEPPPKPPRGCAALARQALEGSFVGWGMPVQSPQVLATEEEQEQSVSSSEEEEEEEEEAAGETTALGSDMEQALLTLAKNSGTMSKYPTWQRTLLRRAREEEMKRFCKAQAVQRRLHEIETALGDLEAEGMKVELALRSQGGSPEQQKTLWMEQLLQLVQKKNSLLAEEAELMITVQELNLEEKQWHLDQELRGYLNQEGALKTPADRQAEEQLLKKLLDVVNQRDTLIRFQEELRLSELA
ncbi:F-actin-monooxygenase MICAL1 [Vulpes lagopus]|uniref:F-actin-monooxygenase MICAL1 n=1 Tax=Vulpes lagopus TaxID=494514 RepID=UPI001BC961EE|nr:F-actin-monooxygenase MICAL1 [Vulpes lagopus]XP_041582194.1 F-actin-monooxygenase MICAL1 [Vulpes lagopus]XP_041582202.1 F-actin-monooxygenase MICAL1 [Vulpes lagopus]XP_041582212.1 F-actin-monooxygenase MICAL1 [Vulpes lagopus]XP_041582222.1 F-actin-monooxygenase MICAL1 [Vulpes lagopus]